MPTFTPISRETRFEKAVQKLLQNQTNVKFLEAFDPDTIRDLRDAYFYEPATTTKTEKPAVTLGEIETLKVVDTSERPATDDAVQALCDWLSEQSEAEWGERCAANVSTFTFKRGRKNIKIIDNRIGGSIAEPRDDRSVWGFVDADTGNIMKAATWNAPDPKRYKRGSIWDKTSWTTRVAYIK